MADTDVLLVRHPETQANVEGRFVGRGDSPLTERGERQLAALTERIVRFAPDVVWTSPLKRARIVAARAGGVSGVCVREDDRLVELDFGVAEGMTWDEIVEAGLAFDYRSAERPVARGGESRHEIEDRAGAFSDSLLALGGRHAVCTHGGVFRAMLVRLLGLCSTDIWAFHIRNGAIAHVCVRDGHGMVEEFRVLG
ncbi:MAG TPA: histidine phosphatase family protein [Coriobacteriia bacterium]|nr:histidine phosphatase family protein [Coriobacteriia bacterium]